MALAPSYNSSTSSKLQATGVWSPPPVEVVATIAAGQTVSDAVEIQGKLVGLYMPADWTAADIGFLAGPTAALATSPIFDVGVARSIPSAQAVINRALSLDLSDWLPWNFIKITTSVAQVAERKITLILAL